MTPLRCFVIPLLALTLASCGFQLRKEVALANGFERVHIEAADRNDPLVQDLARALTRSGATLLDAPTEGAATLRILANGLSTDVLSVGGNARATEYTLRHHVEFALTGPAGEARLAPQTIELTRAFTFDASQALGVAAQTDLLTEELRRDMARAILRRIDAIAHPAASP